MRNIWRSRTLSLFLLLALLLPLSPAQALSVPGKMVQQGVADVGLPASPASTTTYSISGQVTDGGGNPVSGVTIRATACDLTKQPVLLIHGWGGGAVLADDKNGFAQLYPWMQADGYVEGCNLFYATGVRAENSRQMNRQAISNSLRNAYAQLVTSGYPNWQGRFDIIGHS